MPVSIKAAFLASRPASHETVRVDGEGDLHSLAEAFDYNQRVPVPSASRLDRRRVEEID